MKDKIKFSDEMLAAAIDGRKTQTRRPAEFKVREEGYNLNFSGLKSGFYCNGAPSSGFVLRSMGGGCWNDRTYPLHCPYGQAGDVIQFADKDGNIKGEIEIVDVWLQQVQEAGDDDFKAEGYPLERELTGGSADAFLWFRHLWDSVSKPEFNYQANPWVWVIEFKLVTV